VLNTGTAHRGLPEHTRHPQPGRAAKQPAQNATNHEALQIWAHRPTHRPGRLANTAHTGPAARDAVPGDPCRTSIGLTR